MMRNPMALDMKAANEAFLQFMKLNSAQMTAAERATADERYEQVCKKLGFPLSTEELQMRAESKARAKSGDEK